MVNVDRREQRPAWRFAKRRAENSYLSVHQYSALGLSHAPGLLMTSFQVSFVFPLEGKVFEGLYLLTYLYRNLYSVEPFTFRIYLFYS